MKDNTVFHFGTAERKFSCFAKKCSNGRAKHGAEPGRQLQKTRYFLRRTLADATQSDVRRIGAEVIARYQQGFVDLAEAVAWADSLFGQGREFRVRFEPRAANV